MVYGSKISSKVQVFPVEIGSMQGSLSMQDNYGRLMQSIASANTMSLLRLHDVILLPRPPTNY